MRKFVPVLILVLASCSQPPEPLEVTSVYPPDGYHGFTKNEAIEIEFNRPVDPASFTGAYRSDSEGLKPDQVTVTFSEGNTKVTIQPNQPLAYSPDESYLEYSFEVGTELTDANGVPLGEALEVRFSTLRTLTAKVLSDSNMDGLGMPVATDTAYLAVGDSDNDTFFRSFLAFPWPDDAREILAASLTLICIQGAGTPFVDLGNFLIEPVDLGDEIKLDDLFNPALDAPIADDGTGWTCTLDTRMVYDLTPFAVLAWSQGLSRLDLRLRFETDTDNDGAADAVTFFAREAESSVGSGLLPTLELTYYGP